MRGRIRLIVLAAGKSTRMGPRDKLLLPLGHSTVLERTVHAAVESDAGEVVVVTGWRDYRTVLAPYSVRLVENPAHDEGMASSIRTGIRAEGPPPIAYGIMLGDMPFVQPATIAHLAESAGRDAIVVPRCEGSPGHPVFFGAAYRSDLLALGGDVGARSVVRVHENRVVGVHTDDSGVLRDIDTDEAYRRARNA